MFDLMDSTLYTMVMVPAVKELLGGTVSTQTIGWYGGLVFAIFLVGWASGGIFFGIFSDYYGRRTALMITILMYALFTGLSAISHTWWELGIYRFLTGLGVGGEWAAGAALVAETWPERARTKAAAILQMSGGVGYFLAAFINLLVGGYSWRWVFVVGALPALLLLLLRWFVKESERWLETKASSHATAGGETALAASFPKRSTLSQIFSKELRRDTMVGSVLAIIATLGFWAVTSWVPALIGDRLAHGTEKLDAASISRYVSYASMVMILGSIVGYLLMGVLADLWGRKLAFLAYYLGAAVFIPLTFLLPWSFSTMIWFLPLIGLSTMGIFSGFPIYLPELFPTHLRGTGSGFCFNIGRVVAAFGPLMTGTIVMYSGSFAKAISILGLIYLVGPITLLFARETKGQPLQ
ncbi:MAG: MFS transporter [Acidobacteria bacterium]|nr:MFS transporter [Acidobacteriota bacterium]